MVKAVKTSVVLIGMPGAGKSTVGKLLVDPLGLPLVDTDELIESMHNKSLQSILDEDGYMALRECEEGVLLSRQFNHCIVSTGGSAVYSALAMEALKQDGVIVYLEVPVNTLLERIANFGDRGIARHPDQSFEHLFEERDRLYRQYADVTVNAAAGSANDVAVSLLEAIRPYLYASAVKS